MKLPIALICLAFLFSCTRQQPADGVEAHTSMNGSSGGQEIAPTDVSGTPSNFRKKEVNGIRYTVRVMNALELLQHKGEVVAEADKADLAAETVVLLEIGLADLQKDVWKAPQLQLTEEEAMNYLVGEITSDLTIEQDGKTQAATGGSFEGKNGAVNGLRVQLYFAGIAADRPLKVVYYDRLFGAGLVKFGINGL